MFAWLSNTLTRGWTPRSKWTPLLLSAKSFRRVLSKERSRVDRTGGEFGFIVLHLREDATLRHNTLHLAKILHKRLRDTDEKGHLTPDKLGVMLPETGHIETEFVMQEVAQLAQAANLRVDCQAYQYPETPADPSSRHHAQPQFDVAPASKESAVAMMVADYPTWKRALDVTGAAFGLLLGGPIMLLCALAIKLTSRGPVLFQQQRTGFLGQPFCIYKFRTMVVNAEELKADLQESNERDGPAFKMRKDPRITRVGRFLRATGLDELPQLFNVLLGDMSLVGPRPLPVDEARQCAAWQKRREEVKPGLTCFWQISKGRNYSFSDWMRLDLQYARQPGVGLDVRLILKTMVSVVLGRVGH